MPQRRCHYDVLGVARGATEDEIRKAYLKLSLQLHPDKAQQRGEDVAVANARFKELQAAKETLSDPREREWYDAHRDAILRGADPGASDDDSDSETYDGARPKKNEVNLWPFFSASAYDGFDEAVHGERSFYAVYREAFASVEEAEAAEDPTGSPDKERVPSFGDASTPWEDGVKAFYDHFLDFCSARTFAAHDKWRVDSDAPRHVRRAADADNKARRKKAKQEFQDMVRQLALFCRNRDPRVAKRATQVREAKEAKLAEAAKLKSAKREEHLRARQRWRDEKTEDTAFDGYEVRTGTLLGDMDDDDRGGGGGKGSSSSSSSRKNNKFSYKTSKKSRRDDNAVDDDDRTTTTEAAAAAASNRDPADTTDSGDADPQVPGATAGSSPGVLPPEDDDDDEEEEEEEDVVFACGVCKKTFKSDKQLQNHLQSKAHKKKAASVR